MKKCSVRTSKKIHVITEFDPQISSLILKESNKVESDVASQRVMSPSDFISKPIN